MTEPAAGPPPQVEYATFRQLDIRSGVVLEAVPFPEARNAAIKLKIDFGPEIGVRQSSAQLTRNYSPESLVGSEVLAVVNFAPRRIAGFPSQVLVLGVMPDHDPGDVVLVRPDRPGTRGSRLG